MLPAAWLRIVWNGNERKSFLSQSDDSTLKD
jgi:hypothetical protein